MCIHRALANQEIDFEGVQPNLHLNLDYRTNNIRLETNFCKNVSKNQSSKEFFSANSLLILNLMNFMSRNRVSKHLVSEFINNNSSRFVLDYSHVKALFHTVHIVQTFTGY